MTVTNKRNVVYQAGELQVTGADVVLPTKLKLLADAGWSISDAWRQKDGGFRLLLLRPLSEVSKERNLNSSLHKNTARCPDYCDCVSIAKDVNA